MIYYWQAEISATVPNHVNANDFALRNFLIRSNDFFNVQAIAKFLYFRDITIQNPIVATQSSDSAISIHPGLNRFFGACLRKEPEWIPAIILTNKTPLPISGIRWIKQTGKIKAKNLHEHSRAFDQPGVEYEIFMSHWIENTNNARLELLYGSKKGILNPNGTWTIHESIDKNQGIWNTIQKIISQIDNYSL